MKSVGIKQLKARLSEYVRLARRGETILVSDRNEVVAELGPVRQQPPKPDSLDALLDRLARGGQVTRAARSRSRRSLWAPKPLGLPKESVDRLLDELREDR
jgi:prevent-host-death family protein